MGYLKQEWTRVMLESMMIRFPNVSKHELLQIIEETYEERVRDHDALLYNNYDNVVARVTLVTLLDWIQVENPLICESGCFFRQKSKQPNIVADIIDEDMLQVRAKIKKEMFEYLEQKDELNATFADLRQANVKRGTNAVYGSEGEPSSFFYNIHSAISTTSCGRGQLSTATQTIDNFLADAVRFMNMDEFYYYINNIIHEKSEWRFNCFDYIDTIPTKKQFINRFVRKFFSKKTADTSVIESLYDRLDDEMICRLYYKSNMHEFLRQPEIIKIFSGIATSKHEYIDPNKVPKPLDAIISHLVDVLLEFVNYKYSFFRYEDRTRYHRRKYVILMDTDSCFIYYGALMNFILDMVPKVRRKNPSKELSEAYQKADEQMQYNVMNTLAHACDIACHQTLYNYTDRVGIPKEEQYHIKMKNEFYLSRLVTSYAKKSYVGLQYRREGTIFDEPVIDVKGLNFFKSTASKNTADFIYKEILMGELLTKPKVDIIKIHEKIMDYQRRMERDIKNGDMNYLKRSIRVKSEDAYKAPLKISQYKAVFIWNYLNPDEPIELPNTVTIVKVALTDYSDIAALDKYPEIYEKMKKLFDDYTKIFPVSEKQLESGKVKKKITAIALPSDYESIPDWLLDIIDVETIISDNMKLFVQLYKPLGFIAGKSTHAGTSINYYTNIVRI